MRHVPNPLQETPTAKWGQRPLCPTCQREPRTATAQTEERWGKAWRRGAGRAYAHAEAEAEAGRPAGGARTAARSSGQCQVQRRPRPDWLGNGGYVCALGEIASPCWALGERDTRTGYGSGTPISAASCPPIPFMQLYVAVLGKPCSYPCRPVLYCHRHACSARLVFNSPLTAAREGRCAGWMIAAVVGFGVVVYSSARFV